MFNDIAVHGYKDLTEKNLDSLIVDVKVAAIGPGKKRLNIYLQKNQCEKAQKALEITGISAGGFCRMVLAMLEAEVKGVDLDDRDAVMDTVIRFLKRQSPKD